MSPPQGKKQVRFPPRALPKTFFPLLFPLFFSFVTLRSPVPPRRKKVYPSSFTGVETSLSPFFSFSLLSFGKTVPNWTVLRSPRPQLFFPFRTLMKDHPFRSFFFPFSFFPLLCSPKKNSGPPPPFPAYPSILVRNTSHTDFSFPLPDVPRLRINTIPVRLSPSFLVQN